MRLSRTQCHHRRSGCWIPIKMASTIRRTQFSVFWAYSKRGHMEHLRKKIHETRVFDSNALHCRVREAPLSEIIALWEGALHRHWVSRHLDRAINAAVIACNRPSMRFSSDFKEGQPPTDPRIGDYPPPLGHERAV
jgi:hypothetical protein